MSYRPPTDNREHYGGLAIGALQRGGRVTTEMPGYGKNPQPVKKPVMRPLPIRKRVKSAKKGGWLQAADAEMEKKGTEGSFTRSANRAGMSVQSYARKVIADMKRKEKSGKSLTKMEDRLYKRAVFARNMGKIAKKNKKK